MRCLSRLLLTAWLATSATHVLGRRVPARRLDDAAPSNASASTNTTRFGVTCEKRGNVFNVISSGCMCAPCHLCELHYSDMTCHLIVDDDTDLSDGSDIKPKQPILEAEKWFLTESEMTASRGGVPRKDLAVFTKKNQVTTYAVASEYFEDVYDDMENTEEGDRMFFTGWTFEEVPLIPTVERSELNDTNLTAVVARALNRSVDVHILGWANFFETDINVASQKVFNALPAPKYGEALFLFDDRLPDATASNHQKTVVIKSNDGLVAYVGGLDLAANRWDVLAHDKAELRRQSGVERADTDGWMDVQLKIDGPAAKDVAANFLSRWNAKKKPLDDTFDPLFAFTNPNYTTLPGLDVDSPVVINEDGEHAVQIVRTFSCKYDHYEDIAPKGEVSIFHSRLKAILQAQNYIYIEDQYFINVPELLMALIEVLPRLQRLIIVTQPPTADVVPLGYEKYQFDAIAPLQRQFPNKVQVLRTKESRKIYVHSKLVIIDDVYLSIGSSNWNRRSMTADTEITANVVDSKKVKAPEGIQVNHVARDYRIRKFMELSGESYKTLDKLTLVEASNLLDKRAKEADSILDVFQVDKEVKYLIFGPVQHFADPQYQC
ncbi:hypothetical protein Poli38472_010623 [Pythium oligandrum]|uniref:phospholipase D n=1 Tax=Pythium oligandrum TaxID=41045 RepID=A0A8K1FB47_PYTOL|nr:hypothetical protein Poli38472_010623 [Pythium oligandrum]|eukprot:TMW55741.1 hypothetical protein Poli38472_010623 [Pythium oligandrum]